MQDRDQHLWSAKRDVRQLNQNDNQLLNSFENKSYQSRIWSMFEDIEGQIWVGGRGLYFLENNEIKPFEQYNDFHELEDALVLFIYQDRSGVIWIGSEDGLYQLDRKKGIIAGYGRNKKGQFYLPTNKFQHMYQDARGIYWLATEDSVYFDGINLIRTLNSLVKSRDFFPIIFMQFMKMIMTGCG